MFSPEAMVIKLKKLKPYSFVIGVLVWFGFEVVALIPDILTIHPSAPNPLEFHLLN